MASSTSVTITILIISSFLSYVSPLYQVPFQTQARIPTSAQIQKAKQECIKLIEEEPDNSAGFTRLAFHDCVGGCNGCVDLSKPENAGIRYYVERLDEPFLRERIGELMSRADFWILCSFEGLRIAHVNSNKKDAFSLSMKFGRRDCAATPDQPSNNIFPSPIGDLNHVLNFFKRTFGLSPQESTALLGAHTLGEGNPEFSGFDGPWVDCEVCLDNDYFIDMIDRDLNWQQVNVGNATDPRWQWSQNGEENLMLNVDICLAIDIETDSNGVARDTFDETPPSSTLRYVRLYAFSNSIWLRDFAKVFTKLVETTNVALVSVSANTRRPQIPNLPRRITGTRPGASGRNYLENLRSAVQNYIRP